MVRFICGLCVVGLLAATGALAQDGVSTNPNPPKPRAYPLNRINPAWEVPGALGNADLAFRVTGTVQGQQVAQGSLPVYHIDGGGRRVAAGAIAIGTMVKLERFRRFGLHHYYEVPIDMPGIQLSAIGQELASQKFGPRKLWLDGYFLEAIEGSGTAP